MNNMTKKQFAEIICKTFNLKGITSNSFVYVINCTLMGIVTVKDHFPSLESNSQRMLRNTVVSTSHSRYKKFGYLSS